MENEREFIIWLDGFLTAIGEKEDFTNQQWNTIRTKLDKIKDKPKREEKQLLND